LRCCRSGRRPAYRRHRWRGLHIGRLGLWGYKALRACGETGTAGRVLKAVTERKLLITLLRHSLNRRILRINALLNKGGRSKGHLYRLRGEARGLLHICKIRRHWHTALLRHGSRRLVTSLRNRLLQRNTHGRIRYLCEIGRFRYFSDGSAFFETSAFLHTVGRRVGIFVSIAVHTASPWMNCLQRKNGEKYAMSILHLIISHIAPL